MPESDFVFDRDRPIIVGSHGEDDYAFANGEPVFNGGNSELVIQSGTPLGGGGECVVYLNGEDTNFGDATKLRETIQNTIGFETQLFRTGDQPLDTTLENGEYTLLAVLASAGNNQRDWASSELSAVSDWWSNQAEQGLLVMTEDGNGGSTGRAKLGNDIIDACIGSRPYGENDNGYDRANNQSCTTNVPTGHNPALENIHEFIGYGSEATTGSPDSNRGVFYTHDPTDGPRIYGDGSYTRFGDTHINDCADSQQYVNQVIEWLNRDR